MPQPKITFLGAGSSVFARNLLQDLFTFPELRDATISLMDIDPSRLADTEGIAHLLAEQTGSKPTIEATTDLRRALDGADYAINYKTQNYVEEVAKICGERKFGIGVEFDKGGVDIAQGPHRVAAGGTHFLRNRVPHRSIDLRQGIGLGDRTCRRHVRQFGSCDFFGDQCTKTL